MFESVLTVSQMAHAGLLGAMIAAPMLAILSIALAAKTSVA